MPPPTFASPSCRSSCWQRSVWESGSIIWAPFQICMSCLPCTAQFRCIHELNMNSSWTILGCVSLFCLLKNDGVKVANETHETNLINFDKFGCIFGASNCEFGRVSVLGRMPATPSPSTARAQQMPLHAMFCCLSPIPPPQPHPTVIDNSIPFSFIPQCESVCS